MMLRSLLVMMVLCASVNAQQNCRNGRCPAPTFTPTIEIVPAVPNVECLRYETDKPNVWRFKVDGREVGTGEFDGADFLFSPANGGKWRFTPTETVIGQVPAGGIDPDKVAPGGHGGFSMSGRDVDRQSAYEALNGSTIRDDSTHLRLSIIGPEAERKRVLADIRGNPALAEIAAGLVLAEFSAESWAVKGLGFVIDGKPTIYIQAPGGQVLHRQDDYDGAEQLAGAIRRAKEYDPKKDRDLRKPEPTTPPAPSPVPKPTPTPASIPMWLVVGGMIVAYFLLGRGRA
jgi:hypothetical protein